MPAILRFLLIATSVVTLMFISRKISRAQMKLTDGFSWLVLSAFFIVISVCPEIIYWLCNKIGITSPINLVFLFVIFILLMKLFFASIRISQLESRLNDLAQEVAIRDERFVGLKSQDRKLCDNNAAIKENNDKVNI